MRLFLLFLVLLISGLVAGQQYLANNPKKVEYATEQIQRGDVTESVAVTGYAEPVDIHVVQSEVPGVVEEVLVDFNDEVREGQVLARLSRDVQQIELMQAKQALTTAQGQVAAAEAAIDTAQAGVAAAVAGLAAAEKELEIAEDGLQKGIMPPAKVDSIRSLRDQAKANLNAAKSKVRQAEVAKVQAESQVKSAEVAIEAAMLSLEKAELRSSMNGIVLNKDIRVGDTVGRPKVSLTSASLGLFEIAAPLDRMRAIVKVSEADYSRVKVGQQAIFSVDAYPDTKFRGEVVQIRNAPTNDRTAVYYDTVLTIENQKDPNSNEWMIKPRSTISADIQVRHATNVLLVPNSALLYAPSNLSDANSGIAALPELSEGESVVWCLAPDNKPVPRVIKTGITDGFRTEVIGGDLKEGDAVITGEPVTNGNKLKIPISL